MQGCYFRSCYPPVVVAGPSVPPRVPFPAILLSMPVATSSCMIVFALSSDNKMLPAGLAVMLLMNMKLELVPRTPAVGVPLLPVPATVLMLPYEIPAGGGGGGVGGGGCKEGTSTEQLSSTGTSDMLCCACAVQVCRCMDSTATTYTH